MQASTIKGSIEWFIKQVDTIINPSLSFDIKSYIQIYGIHDIFTQEFYKEGRVNYPFLTYQIKSLSLDYSRMGSLISRKQGQALFNRDPIVPKNLNSFNSPSYKGSLSANNYIGGKAVDTIQSVQSVPVILDLELLLITNTPQQVEEFNIAWIYHHLPELNGFFEYEGVEFPISTTLNTELTFPEGEDTENGLVYKQELSCSLLTSIAILKDLSVVKPRASSNKGSSEITLSVGGESLIKVSPGKAL